MVWIWDFLSEVALRHSGEVVMAWVQFLPAIIGAASSIGSSVYGGIKEGKQRQEMTHERNKWNAENEALFNNEYYSDYTQRADAKNIIRQMREEMKRETKAEQNTAVVTGSTAEVSAANKEHRNRAMADLYSNLAAQGQLYKDNVKNRYLSRKYELQGLEYNTMGQQAMSSNNMLYNGLNGLSQLGWASIVGGGNGGVKSGGTGQPKTTSKDLGATVRPADEYIQV